MELNIHNEAELSKEEKEKIIDANLEALERISHLNAMTQRRYEIVSELDPDFDPFMAIAPSTSPDQLVLEAQETFNKSGGLDIGEEARAEIARLDREERGLNKFKNKVREFIFPDPSF